MKFICRECDYPCIVEVVYGGEVPYLCPFGSINKPRTVGWKAFSDESEMRGVCADCVNNDETCSLCSDCRDACNFEPKQRCVPRVEKNEKQSRGKILRKALEIINGERQDQYGNPEDSFALIGEYWTTYLESTGIDIGHIISQKEVAEMMALLKIARMSGQKPKLDNYLDLIGYAALAADFVEKKL